TASSCRTASSSRTPAARASATRRRSLWTVSSPKSRSCGKANDARPENAYFCCGGECLLPSPPPGAITSVQQSNRRGRGGGGEGAAREAQDQENSSNHAPPSPPTPLPPPAKFLQSTCPSRRGERGVVLAKRTVMNETRISWKCR